jgi:hypothetical protein
MLVFDLRHPFGARARWLSESDVAPRRGGRAHSEGSAVTLCNHYSITTNQEAIRELFRVISRHVGNLSPTSACFQTVRRLSSATSAPNARWFDDAAADRQSPVTNSRNTVLAPLAHLGNH